MDQSLQQIEKCATPFSENESHDYDFSTSGSFKYDYKWEGILTKVTESTIEARLSQVSSNEEDELILPLQQIPEDDLELVQVGALFNFYVGYTNSKGTIRNANHIKFRRQTIDKIDIDDILDTMNQIDFDGILEDH